MSLLIKAGITKLSELEIDVSKNWAAKKIENIAVPDTDNDVPRRDTIDSKIVIHAAIAAAHHAVHLKTLADHVLGTVVPHDALASLTEKAFGSLTGRWSLAQAYRGALNKIMVFKGPTADPVEVDPPFGVMDFWSDPAEEVQLAAVAGTKTLQTVTVADLPATATIVRAIAMFKFRMIENTNAAANNLDGATVANTSQVIQVADDTPGTYYDAINFIDNQFGLAATIREGGDVLIGSVDISGAGKVDGNDGYLFRWLLAKADLDSLNFNDVQCGLRIWYSV